MSLELISVDSGTEQRIEEVEPYSFGRGVPVRFSFDVTEQAPLLSLRTAHLATLPEPAGRTPWSVMVATGDGSADGDVIGLVEDERAHNFDFAGEPTEGRDLSLSSEASEGRIWEDGDGQTWLGLCLPQENAVTFDQVEPAFFAAGAGWPDDSSPRLGSGVGQDEGEFIFPLSFDVGPDGRFYVLDADNARIQVFDREGNYITRWGSKGREPGQFDFGSGGAPEDFAGSVAVDDEGFIYVADFFNRRIQKFAPD